VAFEKIHRYLSNTFSNVYNIFCYTIINFSVLQNYPVIWLVSHLGYEKSIQAYWFYSAKYEKWKTNFFSRNFLPGDINNIWHSPNHNCLLKPYFFTSIRGHWLKKSTFGFSLTWNVWIVWKWANVCFTSMKQSWIKIKIKIINMQLNEDFFIKYSCF